MTATAVKKLTTKAPTMRPLRPLGPPTVISLDEAAARDLLSINTYVAQRPMSNEHLNRLCEKADEGLFHDAHVAVAEMRDGRRFLMNGQHCCHMVIRRHKPLTTVMQRFRCDDDTDLATLFSQFDTDISMRSVSDQLRAWVQGTELAAFPIRCVRLVLEGLVLLAQEKDRTPKITAEDRWQMLYDNAELVGPVHELVFRADTGSRRHIELFLRRSPVAAAMILTLRRNRPAALEFWSQVRDGEMLSAASPAFRLREWLRSVNLNTMGRGVATASRREMLVRCLSAWNAQRTGKSTTLRYVASAPLPAIRA